MPLKVETFIQQLREYVGLILDGPATLNEIKLSLNSHSIDLTLIASCARNWDTAPIMEANPKPSPSKPTSQSQLSSDFSPNTSTLSLHIYDGTHGPTINSRELDTLLHLLAVNGGSLEDVTIRRPNVKQLHIIHKGRLP